MLRIQKALAVIPRLKRPYEPFLQFFSQGQMNRSRKIIGSHSYAFARSIRSSSQLILHSNAEIEKMHIRQEKKDRNKSWQVFSEKDQRLKVSLVGLPNCGKSSLFNCLIGQRLAIVDKEYGMTRDRREFNILDGMVTVIDTPGVEVSLLSKKSHNESAFSANQEDKKRLQQDIFKQTMKALQESHVIIFVIDSKKDTLGEQEIMLAKYLKAFNSLEVNKSRQCKILIAANKFDGGDCDQNYTLNEVYSKLPLFPKSSLKLEEEQQTKIFFCSAQEGTGIFELLSEIQSLIPQQLRQIHQQLKRKRKEKFESLVKKMKDEIKSINDEIDKSQQGSQSAESINPNIQPQRKKKPPIARYKIKEWQKDFRDLNPNPEQNEDLDHDEAEDKLIRPQEVFSSGSRGVDIKNLRAKKTIKISFIGRPNVGKSSLINELLGEDKLVVSEVAHTTRDSLATKIYYKSRKLELVDTAGLNTPRIRENDDEFIRKAQIGTILQIQQSHVVAFVMDAFSAFNVDDFTLIKQVIDQGRPVVIVVNKWEAIKEQYRNKARRYLENQIEKNLGELHGSPLVFVSAKMLTNLDLMMDKMILAYDQWNQRISTGLLNNWVEKFKKLDNLPKDAETTLKINYAIQAKTRPPHFIFFVNNKAVFKPNYLRFLMTNLAQEFNLQGIPLRHSLRSTNKKENSVKSKRAQTPKKKTKDQERMEKLKQKYGDFTI